MVVGHVEFHTLFSLNYSRMNPNETPEPRSNNSRVLLWVALVAVLLGINGVLFYLNQQKGQKNEVLTTEVQAKDGKLQEQIKQYEALKADFERQSSELQALGLSNDSLETKIAGVNADLLKLRSFKAGSFSIAQQNLFKQRAQNLEGQLRKKDDDIAQLKKDNETLYTETTTLKEKQNKLTDTISTVVRSNRELTEKVSVASRLQSENIKVAIITSKNKEKMDEKEEFKAKRVEKIKITANLARNDVSPKETKAIYLRILEPDGAALYNLSTGGGTFTVDGQEAFYTQKQDVVYDNTKQKLEFVYAKGAEYKKGQHTVELYESGQLMGKTTFILK
jgi:predicted  nucleic acid-binding Zn-ribbon protein